MPQRARVPFVMAGAVGLMFVLTFGGQQAPYQGEKRGTPGPKASVAENIEKVELQTIQAFVRDDLQFDTTFGAADDQLVDFERAQIGTETARRARLEPETRSWAITISDLARGRIIARIKSEATVRGLPFGPWWTYWWVDRRGPKGTWRSIFIPEPGKGVERRVLPDSLIVVVHPPGTWRQAIARFSVRTEIYKGKDPFFVETWGTCGGCCMQRLPIILTR